MKPFFMAAALIVCLLPGQAAAQGVKDLFKGVQKALEQKADEQITQKVESPCIEKEDVARADTIDRDRQGTWVVETADGRRFQVADLAISGLVQDGSSFAMYLSLAEAATFGFVSQERFTKTYRVHLDYAPAADGGGGVRGLLGAVANGATQGVMKNDFTFTNLAVGGSSLDGKEWCLNVPTSTLRSISLIKN